MSIMQVFKKPGQTAYSCSCEAPTVQAATILGEQLAKQQPEEWGVFCYARPVRQMRLVLDTFYHLFPGNSQLRYRKATEELNGPFDYQRYEGPARDAVVFPLTWKDAQSESYVILDVVYEAARSFHFHDLCKRHVVKFSLKDGAVELQFFDTETLAVITGESILCKPKKYLEACTA